MRQEVIFFQLLHYYYLLDTSQYKSSYISHKKEYFDFYYIVELSLLWCVIIAIFFI